MGIWDTIDWWGLSFHTVLLSYFLWLYVDVVLCKHRNKHQNKSKHSICDLKNPQWTEWNFHWDEIDV